MSSELLQRTVGQLVAERPSRSRIFERWGIDYCCRGKRPLDVSCTELALDVDAVLRDLGDEEVETGYEETDWTSASLSSLIDNIVTTHHAYLQEALPRITMLTQKVLNAHGGAHPELAQVAQVFAQFRIEMEQHTWKEENVLFPYIVKLEAGTAAPNSLCGTISNPIHQLEHEHEQAGVALETLRRLTNRYAIPQGVCATYKAMLDALSELESDTHRHVHKENSILFPRAEALEEGIWR